MIKMEAILYINQINKQGILMSTREDIYDWGIQIFAF